MGSDPSPGRYDVSDQSAMAAFVLSAAGAKLTLAGRARHWAGLAAAERHVQYPVLDSAVISRGRRRPAWNLGRAGRNALVPGRRAKTAIPRFLIRLTRWQSRIAWFAVVVLLFPLFASLGSTHPERILGVALDGHGADGRAAGHHDSTDHGEPYSEIPGAPGHPVDHGCQPCQVLKYLASYLPRPYLTLPPPRLRHAPRPVEPEETQYWGPVASLPPCRGPPQSLT